jgi:hypothetical protein
MTARYAASTPPKPSAEITKDNEKLAQWYLEHVFFRDFVYRNPAGRANKEFSDALVVYSDTIIVIQNKTQSSAKTPKDWAESSVNEALSQLRGSFRMLTSGLVKRFENEVLGSTIDIDLAKHTHLYGMVVLAQDGEPYDAYGVVRKEMEPGFPYVIMTLNDLLEVIDRMDTATDFITYFELRQSARSVGISPLMNDEANTMRKIAAALPTLMQENLSKLPQEVMERTLRIRRELLTAQVKIRKDYVFSLLVDDIIARAHDLDPNWVDDIDVAKRIAHIVGQTYGFLDRERRIAIGKRLLEAAISAQNVAAETIAHIQKPIGQIFLYLFTGMDRKARREYLYAISVAAQVKYKYSRVLAVATEPVGTGGRSYDFIHLGESQLKEGATLPREILERLPKFDILQQLVE